MVCDCEFDPYDEIEYWEDGTEILSVHFRRECMWCFHVWWGLHCPHDGAQNPCPNCGTRPTPVPE